MKNELENVKVGDKVAPMRYVIAEKGERWTGALHEVTKVGVKQFMVGDNWYLKSTGKPRRKIGFGIPARMILATPEILAEFAAREQAKNEKMDELEAFHARRDYQAASAIHTALDEMTVDNDEILSRLTVDEWEALRIKLTAVCLCKLIDGDHDACPVHVGQTKNPPSSNSSMAALS